MHLSEGEWDLGSNARKRLRPEQRLGLLAMQFRGTRDEGERAKIAQDYANVIVRLIESGAWAEIPPPEDQLPDEQMPLAFFQHWSLPVPEELKNRPVAS